ncbi:hypothetical protein Tco_1486146 [Tanacetum coccineum]
MRSFRDASSDKVKRLRDQLAKAKVTADELARTDVKLSDQALVIRDLENELALEKSESQKYRDITATAEQRFNDLRSEVTHFVGSDVDNLVRKLFSSDEFNATLVHILSLGITSGVKRGLCMGRIDAEFEEASQNVSNFFLGAQAKFDEAVAALPSTHFPFLAKISEATKSLFVRLCLLLLLLCPLLLVKCLAGLLL